MCFTPFSTKERIKQRLQLKAAIPRREAIPYLLFVGPYFTPVKFGPFNPQQLGVRTRKSSSSADYKETLKAKSKLTSPLTRRKFKLYLLGTNDIISSTDTLARPLIQEAANYQRMLTSLLLLITRSKDFTQS